MDADQDGSPEPETLYVGDSEGTVLDWLRGRWPRGLALLAACLAFIFGVASMYVWTRWQRLDEPRIDAALYLRQVSNVEAGQIPIAVRIRNGGRVPLTIEETQLQIPGFTVMSSGSPTTAPLSASNSMDLSYTLLASCDTSNVRADATIRIRVQDRRSHQEWITVGMPLPVTAAPGRTLSTLHQQVCDQVGAIRLQTLHASTSDNVLSLQARLTAIPLTDDDPPAHVRLVNLGPEQDDSMLHVTFTGPGQQDSVDLPATGLIRIRVNQHQCFPLTWPAALTASLATSNESGDAEVLYDAEAAAQVLTFTTKRCNQHR